MAPLAPISYASTIIGFMSFAITLVTLAGVYRDLISTMRKAPTQISVVLGNLRVELISEREQLRRKVRRCHDPHHVQITSKSLMTRKGPRSEELLYLFQRTIKNLWIDFKNLERPFLVEGGRRAEMIRKGDYWGESDVEEKAGAKVDDSRAGLGSEPYYQTDLSHRFIWWQCKDDVLKLADQLQRIQIRRIERDVFETEELARRCLRILSGGDTGTDEEGSGGSGSDSDGGGGIRRRRRRSGGGRRSRSMSLPPVASARNIGRAGVGEVVAEQKESVKVRGDTTDGLPGGRRERDRDRGSRFEVVRPERDASGRIVVDVGGPVDVERRRDRDRDRDRPAPVYMERERSRYGDHDRDRYR